MAENIAEVEVLMPVPVRLAEQVAQIVADLKAGRPVAAAEVTEGADVVEVPGQGPWDEQKVTKLEDVVTYAGVRALFDRCAREPGVWIEKHVVEDALGISAIQLRNELGALSKLTKREFGITNWPIEWKKDQGTYKYRMTKRVASWWIAAVENAR